MPGPLSPAVSTNVAGFLDSVGARCQLWAEQDEGPYRLDYHPRRRDITEDRVGVPLSLGVGLSTVHGIGLGDAVIEIWHCDAEGQYSGFPPPLTSDIPAARPAHPEYRTDQTFLRGSQETDPSGRVEFLTIYPGWYPGRTIHIHVIARALGVTSTSQLYVPEPVTAAVFARPPYAQRPGRDTTNDDDVIFPTGGEPAVLDLAPAGDGYIGAIWLRLPEAVR